MKIIPKNKWIIVAATIFGFASFANATYVNYVNSRNTLGTIDQGYVANVTSACYVFSELTILGDSVGHIEVWNDVDGQVTSLDSSRSGSVYDTKYNQPAGTYYTDHWGYVITADSNLYMRTYISW